MNSNKIFRCIFYTVAPLLLFGAGCTCNEGRPTPDISGIEVDLKLQRFEKDLFAIQPNNIENGLQKLQQAYPEFYPLYIERIMNFAKDADSIKTYSNVMQKFLANKAIQGLHDTIVQKYNDLSKVEKEIETAFRYYKYYFPDSAAPKKIITFLSEFAYGAFTYGNIIGLGLDMYLGKDYVYYPSIGFPKYLIRRLEKEYIPANAVKVWGQDLHPEPKDNAQLIDQMISNGIVLYFMERLLPNTPDSILIGYTAKEVAWAHDNEPEIWNYFLKHDLLYSTDFMGYRKYVSQGPSTSGMPPGSPGNVGSWVGWQIVRKYMDKHEAISLEELMQMYNGQKILEEARYKPKRGI